MQIVLFILITTLIDLSIKETSYEKKIMVLGVGDMMIGTNYPSKRYLPINDGRDIFKDVSQIINKADIAFGNLEGTLLTGQGEIKNCSDPKKCYAFKSPDNYVENYKNAGFDIVSIANNHINDFGEIGRKNTQRVLEENGIYFSGTIEKPYTIFTKDSTKYGFASFSPNKGTIQINNYKQAKEIISYLDSICDIVIVSFHGGAEGTNYNRVTREREYFLGEDRGNPYEFSRLVIDNGADIVFGHGPHVVRSVDIYKDRFIAFSLGNFATYARFNLKGIRGIAPIVQVNVNTNGKFIDGRIISAKQIGLGTPVLDIENKAANEIYKLTKLDFPESQLIIDNEGYISYK
tara:strand:- start:525 stop:1565 length:1041 start_codon:yes stop_codon:yes gene_type:complete